MTVDTVLALLLLASVPLGPLAIAARAVAVAIGGTAARHRWRSVSAGLMGGFGAAILLAAAGSFADPVDVALLGLLALLIVMDLRWRWLPLEWCAAIGLAALVRGWLGDTLPDTILAACVVAGTLAILRFGWLHLRGVEVLGLGDIWLIAAFSGHLGVVPGFGLIGLAALSGLIHHIVSKRLSNDPQARYGVAYGAHLCICFAIFHPLFPMLAGSAA